MSASPPTGTKTYRMVVLTNPVAGKEDQYNEWYTGRHLDDVLRIPGVVGAQRFKIATKPMAPAPVWNYAAIYDMETNDPQAVVDTLASLAGTDKIPIPDALDPDAHAAVYEAITPVVRKKS